MSKKFLAGVFAVALLAFAGSAVAAYDFGATTLKVGSRGEAVKNVQIVVGATPVDGIFGAMTKAKVMAWQAANGLAADGLFGAMSKAKANTGTVPVVGGTLCPNGMLLSNNCNAPSTPTTPTTPSTLKGAEGYITATKFTSGTETTLGEGKSEKVLGVKVAADDGSDVAINTMKVVIDTPTMGSGSGESTRLERYIEEVVVYLGSEEVGSVDVSDFSKNGTTYTKSISLSDAVVKADTDAKFYVEVEAKSDISSELLDNTWKIAVTSARYTDAMGVVTTEPVSSVDVVFGFESSTQNDKITSTSSSSNPEATTLKVSDTGTSDEYMVLAFKLKADKDSSDLNVLELPIKVVTATSDVEDVVSDIYFKVGSQVYDDYTLTNGNTKTGTYKFEIDEGDLSIDSGDIIEVKVYAEFMREGLDSTYKSNETATFSFDPTLGLIVENLEGDSVSNSTVTARNGNVMTLSTSSTIISGVTTDSDIDKDGKVATYIFKFTVEADGDDVTLDTNTIVESLTGPEAVTPSFSIKKDSGNATGTLGSTYTVSDGDEATFTVTYMVDPSTSVGVYYVTIDTIDGVTVDKTAGPESITAL